MTQAEFLGRLGVAERAARLMAANPKQAGEIEAGVQRLISPTGMGALFKVLAIRSRAFRPRSPSHDQAAAERSACRRRRELPITLTEESAMAAAAIMGDSSKPVSG